MNTYDVSVLNDLNTMKKLLEDRDIFNALVNEFGVDEYTKYYAYVSGILNNNEIPAFNSWKSRNQERIMNCLNGVISRRNSSHSSGSISTSSSDASSSSSEDVSTREEESVTHKTGNNYSSEYAKRIIEEQLKELNHDIDLLDKESADILLRDKKIREDLMKKKTLRHMLNDLKNNLSNENSLDNDNKKMVGYDEKIIGVDEKLEEKQKEYDALNKMNLRNAGTKMKVQMRKAKLNKQIERLNVKQGKMLARQRKVTDKKLNSIYKRANLAGKKWYLDTYSSSLTQEINNNRNKMESLINSNYRDKGIIKSKIYKVKDYVSYAKFGVVNKYCSLLRLKNGAVNGLVQLPNLPYMMVDAMKKAVSNQEEHKGVVTR